MSGVNAISNTEVLNSWRKVAIVFRLIYCGDSELIRNCCADNEEALLPFDLDVRNYLLLGSE